MAHTTGKVIGIEKNGWARVITERTDACSGCQTKENCHSCLTHTKIETRAINVVGAKTGDLVSVSIKTETILKSAAVLYLVPIMGLLAGALSGPVIGKILSLGETVSAIVFGFIGFSLGFIVVFFYSKKISAQKRLTPILDQIIISQQTSSVPKITKHICQSQLCHSGKV